LIRSFLKISGGILKKKLQPNGMNGRSTIVVRSNGSNKILTFKPNFSFVDTGFAFLIKGALGYDNFNKLSLNLGEKEN
jgi:hypothetical protein